VSEGPRIVIVGAGPTGLGAAWRLQELGHTDWVLYEASNRPGGLASSVVDDKGFTWDLGGHVLFSHYRYFDDMMTRVVEGWLEHVREAWVWMRDTWIPYPLQNNIWRLPSNELIACLEGLLDVYTRRDTNATPPRSFGEWLLASFGAGLFESFLLPYNRKVWAYDPSMLDVGWMSERVATVDFPRIMRSVVLHQDDAGWGPNSTFRFPLRGGTGAIWNAVCQHLPSNRIHFGRRLIRIDVSNRAIAFDSGETVHYDYLISTIPLDVLLESLSDRPALTPQAAHFVHSSTHIVGIGLAGRTPAILRTKCWMYFPEPLVPFHRCTVFSNYSPNNVPHPGHEWSLMAEVSESPERRVDGRTVVSDVVAGLRASRLICGTDSIVSTWHARLEYGYPTPWLGRQPVLDAVDAGLRQAGIFSRGRFGAWKYEVSNQDHSLMQGVEAVNHILLGERERTYYNDVSA
jgi:protoporphyrinogen oxidase